MAKRHGKDDVPEMTPASGGQPPSPDGPAPESEDTSSDPFAQEPPAPAVPPAQPEEPQAPPVPSVTRSHAPSPRTRAHEPSEPQAAPSELSVLLARMADLEERCARAELEARSARQDARDAKQRAVQAEAKAAQALGRDGKSVELVTKVQPRSGSTMVVRTALSDFSGTFAGRSYVWRKSDKVELSLAALEHFNKKTRRLE